MNIKSVRVYEFVLRFSALIMLVLATGVASATTITAGSGTLSFNVKEAESGCIDARGQNGVTIRYTFSDFSYTASGKTTTLGGTDVEVISVLGGGNCPASANPTISWTVSPYVISFFPEGNTGVASLTPASYPGFINPKYVVVGVSYAPPGPSSYAQYTNVTTIGNTSTVSNTFSSDVGFSISVTNQAGIPSAVANSSGGVTLTYSSSYDFTVTENTSTTVTVSKTTSVAYKTPGVPTAFSPVDHDYDYIWLWLNPEVLFTVTPATSKIQWNGYAYDPADPSGTGGPDIYAVQVGCLNGHFSCPSATTILARTWATDVTWPAGQGPGLTSTDMTTILASDPPASSSYTDLNSLPSTTADGRYTQGTYPPNPINYSVGGLNTMYSLAQTDTQSVASGASYQVKESFGLSEKLSASFLGIWGTSTTYTETDTLIWNYSWLNTLTTTTTVTDALSVTGPPDPPPPYTGPGEFIYYQDNLYGTFLFFPSN
jgi:hypothetical protein